MGRESNLIRGSLAVGVLCLFGSSDARAATAQANLAVSANVSATCSISTTALAFGTYDPVGVNAGTALDATGGVVVTCTNGATTAVTLGQGLNAGGGSTDAAPLRRMLSGANYLSYLLYQNAGHTTVWGNTAGTSLAHTGAGSATTLTVYGRVAAAQNVPSGSYTDTVVATVTF